jgi:hypothetical protein
MGRRYCVATLFEIRKKPLERLVKDSSNIGTIYLIKQLFDEKNIEYNETIFSTWFKIRDLRNMYPIHFRYDPLEFASLLSFFNTELSSPPNYSELWDNILRQFSQSLFDLLEVMNLQLKKGIP